MSLIRFCPVCREYTLEEKCGRCGGDTIVRKPARFSPQDRYGSYRLSLKRMERSDVR